MLRGQALQQKIRIRLIFSIADLQSAEDFDPAEDEGGASAETGEASYPLRCSLTVTKVCTHTYLLYLIQLSLTCRFDKPTVPGALSIDAVCQEGVFVVENVSYYNDSKLATDLTPEADWKRRGLYIGPQVRLRPIFCCFVETRVLRCICHVSVSSKRSTLTSRRSLRSSSRSVASMRASRFSFPNTRSTRNKRWKILSFIRTR